NDYDFFGSDLNTARTAYFLGNGFTKLRQTCRWTVMRPAGVQRVNPSVDDVRRSIKIGLADFEMDNVFALPLQSARPVEDFKRRLRAQSRHALSQPQLELDGPRHRGKRIILLPLLSTRFLMRTKSLYEGSQSIDSNIPAAPM